MLATKMDEIFCIWVPWLAIMLAFATAFFFVFRWLHRSNSLTHKVVGIVGFAGVFVFGVYVVLTPGDPLSTVPMFLNSAICLVYAITILASLLLKYRLVPREHK